MAGVVGAVVPIETSATTVTSDAAVTRPSTFTVTRATLVALPYVAAVTPETAMVGFGYIPARDPPAVPEGGKDVGAPVIFPHATSLILASVTASIASAPVVPFRGQIVGWGWVPARSPPAAPDGGKLVGAPVTLLQATSLIFAFVTARSAREPVTTFSSPIVGLG